MNKNPKTICAKCFIMMCIVIISSNIAFSAIWKNWRECVNDPNCIAESSTLTLKTYVIESAGHFLNSHSDYQAFLNRVELAETSCIEYNELREILYSAIENMEKAKAAYTNLKTTSERTPYNQPLIDKLVKFDYDGFRVQYGLIEPIFAKVKSFLGKGDIEGLDKAVLANMDIILIKLYGVKIAVDENQFPEIALLWRINQEYTEIHLFGQYVSEVFKANLGI